MFRFLGKLFAGGIVESIGGLVKTIFGDREAKDRYKYEQEMAVQQSYAAEFYAPEKKHWFNIFVDGANRLVRPIFTYGMLAMFIWAAVDPVNFLYYIQAVQVVPEMFWYVMLTIIVFWFGGRLIEGGILKGRKIDPKVVSSVVEEFNKRNNELPDIIDDTYTNDDYMNEMNDRTKPLSNKAIMEWNNRNKKKE